MNKTSLLGWVSVASACAISCADAPSEASSAPAQDMGEQGVSVVAHDGGTDARTRADADAPSSPRDAAAPSAADGGLAHAEDPSTAPVAPHDGSVLVGYYPAWGTYERNYQVSDIPGGSLTHVNYAFANVADGGCVLGDAWADVQKTFAGDSWDESSANQAGNFKQLRALKSANPALRTIISVGGWTWSGGFSDVALTDDSRAKFASSCVDFMVDNGFDGIDIDWEYPAGGGLDGNTARPDDTKNYTLLLRALRDRMTSKQSELARAEAFVLTIAAPAGPSTIQHIEPSAIAPIVDWINVMTYDFHGGWETTTGHDAPLVLAPGDGATGFSVEAALQTYLDAGVPAAKLVMGVPFYGHSFAGVSAGATHGLRQSTTGVGPGTWEDGTVDYADVAAHYLNAAGFTRYYDDAEQVPYLFNERSGVFISYDDPDSLAKKAAYARSAGLLGTMIWDLSSDTPDHALLSALR